MSEHNQQSPSEEGNTDKNDNKKKSFTPVIVLAIVVFAVIAFLNYSSKKAAPQTTNEQKGTSEEQALPIDPADETEWTYLTSYMSTSQLKELLPEGDPQKYRDAMIRGVKDAFSDDEVRFSDEQLQAMIERRQEIEQERFLQKAEANKKAGEEFVANYAKEDGIKKTENGTLYKVLTTGDGELVGDKTALVTYVGKHINGKEFDSSQKHGEKPVPFDKNILPGLREAIALMHVGDKWEIIIPVDSAYGKDVPPNAPIEPNEALIFEIDVRDIAPDKAPQTGTAN